MKKEEEFYKWFDEYFCDQQGEDSPYSFEDIKRAFNVGWRRSKQTHTNSEFE